MKLEHILNESQIYSENTSTFPKWPTSGSPQEHVVQNSAKASGSSGGKRNLLGKTMINGALVWLAPSING